MIARILFIRWRDGAHCAHKACRCATVGRVQRVFDPGQVGHGGSGVAAALAILAAVFFKGFKEAIGIARLVAALEPDDVVLGGGNVKRLKRLPDGSRVNAIISPLSQFAAISTR